jgi:hypothetical protein
MIADAMSTVSEDGLEPTFARDFDLVIQILIDAVGDEAAISELDELAKALAEASVARDRLSARSARQNRRSEFAQSVPVFEFVASLDTAREGWDKAKKLLAAWIDFDATSSTMFIILLRQSADLLRPEKKLASALFVDVSTLGRWINKVVEPPENRRRDIKAKMIVICSAAVAMSEEQQTLLWRFAERVAPSVLPYISDRNLSPPPYRPSHVRAVRNS